jgi:hypothetical protein
MDAINTQPLVALRYSIAQASSYSGSYEPHNILHDRPHDIKSRWTGAAVAAMAAASSNTVAGAAEQAAPVIATRDGGVGSHPSSGTSRAANNSGSGVSSNRSTTSPATNAGTPSAAAMEKQYIILKLEKLSILRKIRFGKFYKAHPCNLKDFKVYGSATSRDPRSKAWVRLLRGGLKNDAVPEAFDTRWTTTEGVPFPVRYVKLVPLATHVPNYNFSVWYVALEGICEAKTVSRISSAYHEHRESLALRLILKHLRSRAYHSAFQVLLETSGLDGQTRDPSVLPLANGVKRPFEQPIVTQLFNALMQGSWDIAEQCLERAAWGESAHRQGTTSSSAAGTGEGLESEEVSEHSHAHVAASLLTSYVERSTPKPKWSQLLATDLNGDAPSGRGGHQMELDVEKGILWLFGGWDGKQDLADLWAYHIREERWRCVSRDTRQQGGPSPRSCHKMVFDPRTGFLYVLGKYVDYDRSETATTSSSTEQSSNVVTSAERSTASDGNVGQATLSGVRGLFMSRFPGAALADMTSAGTAEEEQDEVFVSNRGGHMRLNANAQRRNAPSDSTSKTSSGYEADFFRFATRSERWDRLSADTYAEGGPKLIFDHQMLIDPETQLLFVFGGRVAHPDANRMELSGMWKYDVIQRSWTFLFDDQHTHPQSRIPSRVGHTMLLDTPKSGPMAGKRVIWVLAGQRGVTYMADMWTYQLNNGVVREVSRDYSLAAGGTGPEGGFTQRAVIDSDAREIYLFSGYVRRSKNRGEQVRSAFWVYHIERNDWRIIYEYGSGKGGKNQAGRLTDSIEAAQNGDEEVDEEAASEIIEPGRGPTLAFPQITSTDTETADRSTLGGYGESDHGDVPMSSTDGGPPISSGISPRASPFAKDLEPRPRYAAQMVYDVKRRNFYIFGGNPAEGSLPSTRLDDLWNLELVRPSVAEVLRKAKFKLRQQRFLEMADELNAAGLGAMQALIYLQTQVAQVVNHEIAEEGYAFRKLMSHLLHTGGGGGGASSTGEASVSPMLEHMYDPASSPWMSPMPGVAGGTHEAAEVSGTFLSPTVDVRGRPSASTTIGGEGLSDSEGDSDMLSVSQTLPDPRSGSATPGPFTLLNSGPPTFTSAPASSVGVSPGVAVAQARSNVAPTEGQPSQLYRQRYYLFRALSEFFPPNAVEPSTDLLDCLEMRKATV